MESLILRHRFVSHSSVNKEARHIYALVPLTNHSRNNKHQTDLDDLICLNFAVFSSKQSRRVKHRHKNLGPQSIRPLQKLGIHLHYHRPLSQVTTSFPVNCGATISDKGTCNGTPSTSCPKSTLYVHAPSVVLPSSAGFWVPVGRSNVTTTHWFVYLQNNLNI